MIDKQKIKLCAQNIIKCINIKKNECVYIKGGIYCQNVLEEVALNVLRAGAYPQISSTSDDYSVAMYEDDNISIETLEKTPNHFLKMVENIEAYIVIEPFEDPSVQNKFSREKIQAVSKASTPIRDILYGAKPEFAPGKKWLYAGWPSKKAADFYGIDYTLFEQFIIDGMSVSVEDLVYRTQKLKNLLQNAQKIYVKDEFGSDFWVSIENRRINLDAGVLTDEMIEMGDLGGNLPAGEVFIAPNEKIGGGKLFCPLTNDRFSHKIIKNVELVFKDGKLLMNKITAEENLDDLLASFKQCEEIDKTRELVEIRTYNVAEIGIGCNPKITKAIGYILTDEKIFGSVHLAFGDNKSYGGTSTSQMHWDFVTAPKEDITVEYIDGSKKKIMEQGKLIE